MAPWSGRQSGDSVGDTANWEFAAVVAAVAIGLGGLLLFTLVALIALLRTLGREPSGGAWRPSGESLAQLPPADVLLAESAAQLLELTRRADALLGQQARLVDAIRHLVEAGVLRVEASAEQHGSVMDALRNVEGALAKMAPPHERGQKP